MRIGRAAALTDTGRRRLGNEDAFVCEPPLFAVADGMGGAQAGELASRLAAAALEESARASRARRASRRVVQDANERIFQRAARDPDGRRDGDDGDRRARRRGGGHGHARATSATRGPTAIRDGRSSSSRRPLARRRARALRPADAGGGRRPPHRSVITRALGTEADVEVDTLTVDLRARRPVLLCSDGLTTMVRDEEILRLLETAGGDPARRRGGARRRRERGRRRGQRHRRPVRARRGSSRSSRPAPGRRRATASHRRRCRPRRRRRRRATSGGTGAGRGAACRRCSSSLALLALAAFLLWWSLVR